MIYCQHPVDVASGMVLLFANLICLWIFSEIFMSLDKVPGYWAWMFFGWVGIIAIQGCFFWIAIGGTECGDFVKGLVKELLNRKK